MSKWQCENKGKRNSGYNSPPLMGGVREGVKKYYFINSRYQKNNMIIEYKKLIEVLVF